MIGDIFWKRVIDYNFQDRITIYVCMYVCMSTEGSARPAVVPPTYF